MRKLRKIANMFLMVLFIVLCMCACSNGSGNSSSSGSDNDTKKNEGKEAFKLNSDMIPGFYDADGYRFFTFEDYNEDKYLRKSGNKITCEWRSHDFWDDWCDRFDLWEDVKWHEHLNLLYNLDIKTGTSEDREALRDAEKKIGNWYEGLHDVTVVLPKSIEAIYDSFKEEIWLSKVYLPDGLKIIGEKSFSDCYNLEYVNIPDSVTEIDKYSFRNCVKLDTATQDKIERLRK